MKNHTLLTIVVIASLMLACDFVTTVTTPPTPIVIVVTQLVAVATSLPQQAATEAPPSATSVQAPATVTPELYTPTPSFPMVTPLKDPVNCRFGPSVNFEQVFALAVGASAQITAKSADSGWWQVQVPNGYDQNCWVANSVIVITGDLSGIPTLPAPAALVTDAKLQVKPDSTNLGPGCAGPFPTFSLKGSISVNGPLEVTWHIETEQDGHQPDHTIHFSKFGSQDISFDYTPSSWKKGNFWVHLVITSPKSMYSEATYQIKCQ